MEVWHTVKNGEKFGAVVEQSHLDWSKVMARKDDLIGKFVGGKPGYLEKMGVDYVAGEAKFVPEDTVRVGDDEYTADRFLIGVGSKPNMPSIPGIEFAGTNRDLLQLKKLPKSMVLIGGGVISLEFANIYNTAGVDVTILHRGDVLLRTQDHESSKVIEDILVQDGITVLKNAEMKEIQKTNGTYRVHYQQDGQEKDIHTDLVVMNVGRNPDVNNLGLDQAGVEYGYDGIEVNDYLQTKNERIYAGGDCIGGLMLTPIAAVEAKVAMRNAFQGNHETVDYSLVPLVVFTSPPVASVGKTEQELQKDNIDYRKVDLPMTHNGTTILLGEVKGYAKILYAADSGQILGFHMVGIHADDIVHQLAIAMKAKFTVQQFGDVIQVHPTVSEAIIELSREAAKDFRQQKS